MVIEHLPPRIFEILFGKYIGTYWGGQKLFMQRSRPTPRCKKVTSRVVDGCIPYCFMQKQFNKNYKFLVKRPDQIKRDIKEFNVTYGEPLGILRIEGITIYKTPFSPIWQSLE